MSKSSLLPEFAGLLPELPDSALFDPLLVCPNAADDSFEDPGCITGGLHTKSL